jgi:hypothetical protein
MVQDRREGDLAELGSAPDRHFAQVVAGFDLGKLLSESGSAVVFQVAQIEDLHVMGQDVGAVGTGIQVIAGKIGTLKTEGHIVLCDAVVGGAIAIRKGALALVLTAAGAGQVFAFETLCHHLFQQFGIVFASVSGAAAAVGPAGSDVFDFSFGEHDTFLSIKSGSFLQEGR